MTSLLCGTKIAICGSMLNFFLGVGWGGYCLARVGFCEAVSIGDDEYLELWL